MRKRNKVKHITLKLQMEEFERQEKLELHWNFLTDGMLPCCCLSSLIAVAALHSHL
jgi:hypothetical protein